MIWYCILKMNIYYNLKLLACFYQSMNTEFLKQYRRIIDEYNNLLSNFITQAQNDYMQFNEVKEDDNKEKIKLLTKLPSLSNNSNKLIEQINYLATDIYNNIYFGVNESECNCGATHDHSGYAKFEARLIQNILEIRMHYLLKPLTRTKLHWEIYGTTPNNNIFRNIVIKINLVRPQHN